MSSPFLAALEEGPLLADGAVGTQLHARGAPLYGSLELLNAQSPELVLDLHLDYLRAGARLLTTNTFQGHRLALARHGLQGEVWALNVAAVKLARQAREMAGQEAFVGASLGPCQGALAPLGPLEPAEVEEAYREQVRALVAGGADLFLLETFSDPRQLALALRAVRAESDLPAAAFLTFSADGTTLFGTPVERALEEFLEALGDQPLPELMGVNCGAGPAPSLESLARLEKAVAARVPPARRPRWALSPNAGLPERSGGRVRYPSRPAYFAETVARGLELGARLVGGCCGTSPEHVARLGFELARRRGGEPPAPRGAALAGREAGRGASLAPPAGLRAEPVAPPEAGAEPAADSRPPAPAGGERAQARLADRLGRRLVVSLELDPPRGAVAERFLAQARKAREAGVDCVNVGDSPMARVRMSSLAAAHLVQREAGVEAILHFTTRDRNLMGLQADLLGAHALGVRNVLALTGDPPALGNYAHATAVYDLDSIGLIRLLRRLNGGEDAAGNRLARPTDFLIGCALNPAAADLEREVERFRAKVAEGAHFAMTQPVYDPAELEAVLDRLGGAPLPLLAGLMPLASYPHALYLHNEVPGIRIPEAVLRRMEEAGAEARRVGLEVVQEVWLAIRPWVAGAYVVPSFQRVEDALALVRWLRGREPGG
ncbi:MAG: bifunctional homocysteine S-methyltransferase/methylenetetrahydrofolate reductase [Bacillota bacterium]|nr:bifunctional homocysteine S-methyltransferase/methylenetetrahydrofolate reductase [Bacillota bacterium]